MSRARPNAPIADLRCMLAVLAQERAALLCADFDRLERLGARKKALLGRLDAALPTADSSCEALLAQVQRAAARNTALYESAMAGVRDAHKLLDHVRNPPPGRVYGRNGARSALDTVPGTMERRA